MNILGFELLVHLSDYDDNLYRQIGRLYYKKKNSQILNVQKNQRKGSVHQKTLITYQGHVLPQYIICYHLVTCKNKTNQIWNKVHYSVLVSTIIANTVCNVLTTFILPKQPIFKNVIFELYKTLDINREIY